MAGGVSVGRKKESDDLVIARERGDRKTRNLAAD